MKYPLIVTSDTWEGVWHVASATACSKAGLNGAATLTLDPMYPPRMNVMGDGRPPCIIVQFILDLDTTSKFIVSSFPVSSLPVPAPLRPEDKGPLNGLTAAEEEVKFAAVANCRHSAQDWRSEDGKIFCDECHPRKK